MTGKWVELALRQGGVISAAQLAACGESTYTIRQLVAGGILVRVSRGVYFMAGSVQSDDGFEWRQSLWIALLRGGSESFAYRRSAAALWGLDGIGPGAVDVAVSRGHPRWRGSTRLSGIVEQDIVRLDNIRLTTVERTLMDLGAAVSPAMVERSLESALRRKLVTPRGLLRAADRSKSRGSGTLRRVIVHRGLDTPPTESDAETLFVLLVREMGLPDPRRQIVLILGGLRYRLDFAWPELRLAVEIDGAAVHGPGQLGRDLRRQNQIVLDGWLLIRFTWHMIARDPRLVERDLRAAWSRCSLTVPSR
jgi:very-short-patch-repair endonuclease